jgi:hypothetical protein
MLREEHRRLPGGVARADDMHGQPLHIRASTAVAL